MNNIVDQAAFLSYFSAYVWIVVIFTSIYALLLLNNQQYYNSHKLSIFQGLLIAVIATSLGLCPFTEGSDKFYYFNEFQTILEEGFSVQKDFGWQYYVLFFAHFLNVSTWFVITAFIYVIGFYIFSMHYGEEYSLPLFLLFISFFLFFSYGVNTIRSGMACSIMMIAFTLFKRSILLFSVFAFFSCMIHASMLLPIIAFLIGYYYQNIRFAFGVWLICILLSLLAGRYFEYLFAPLFENRATIMLDTEDITYKSGFRIDFVLYSLVPIIIGYYQIIRNNFNDHFYKQIYITYLISNAFWILVIRANFTDRIAFLSWIFYPILLAYPFIKGNYSVVRKNGYIALCLLGQTFFMLFMYLK